jgi:hypothetical protein
MNTLAIVEATLHDYSIPRLDQVQLASQIQPCALFPSVVAEQDIADSRWRRRPYLMAQKYLSKLPVHNSPPMGIKWDFRAPICASNYNDLGAALLERLGSIAFSMR